MDTGATASYIYKAEGARVHANVGGAVEEFLNGDGPQSLTIVDASQNPVETDYSFGGRPLATATTGGMFFAATDTLGTVRARLNASGAIVESDTSWPYGEFRNYSNSISRLHFTGKLDDTESGLDYFGARYYNPTIAQFLTPDWSATPEPVPYANLENPQSLNLYSYVLNNPVTATDADGHVCIFGWGTCSANAKPKLPVKEGGPASDRSFLGSLRDGLLGARDAFTNRVPANASSGERQAASVEKLVLMGGVGEFGEVGEAAKLIETAVDEGGTSSRIMAKAGGMEQATKDFDALPGAAQQRTEGVLVKDQTDGTKVILRNSSSDGRPTVEIQHATGQVTKILYGGGGQ